MKIVLSIILIGMAAFTAIGLLAILWFLIREFFEDFIMDHISTPVPYPRLKFSQFKKFYDVNPDRWALYDNYVACLQQYGRHEHFSFNLFDLYFNYKPFLKMVNKNNEKDKDAESYLKMIAAVKQDIANFEERNAAELDSKINEIWRETK